MSDHKDFMSAHKDFMSAHKELMSTHTFSSDEIDQVSKVHFYDRIQLLQCLKNIFFFLMSAHKK
jgi:hypothetical protein